MTTRLIDNPVDYALVSEWWVKHQGVAVPFNLLPPVGVMAMDEDGTPAAAGWLYMAVGIGVAWMSWSVTNPNIPPIRALRALATATSALEAVAVAHDYHIVFTETAKPSLARWMQARGYVRNHSGAIQLFKSV